MEVQSLLSSLGEAQNVFRNQQKEIAKLEEKVKKERERGDRFFKDTKIMRAKMQYYDKAIAANDNYRAELKNVKSENERLIIESTKYRRMLEVAEKKLVKEQEKRVRETNQLKRKLSDLEHDKPVNRKPTVRNGRTDEKTDATPYKASTKVGKREMVLGYFTTPELAREAEEKARGIL